MTSGDPRVLRAEVDRLSREAAEVRRNLAALIGADPDTSTTPELVDRVRDELEARRDETPHLVSMGPGGGGFTVQVRPGRELVKAIAVELQALLDAEAGPNYVEWDVHPAGQRDPYRLILVRPGGKSPHQLISEAVAEAAMLRRRLRDAGAEP